MTLTMDSPKLRQLPRTRLQSLAKREFIRAVGKTEAIIRRLIQKHPKGVPILEEEDNPSASSAPSKRIVLKISRKGTLSVSVIPRSFGDQVDSKGKGKAATEDPFSSPSSSEEALELLYPDDYAEAGPSNSDSESLPAPHFKFAGSGALPDQPTSSSREPNLDLPYDADKQTHRGTFSRDPSDPGRRVDGQYAELEAMQAFDIDKGAPTDYMVVDALRQFTTLANAIPTMETRISESRRLLARTESLLEKMMPDARELAVTREYLETFHLAKMKEKRELWDGTAKMAKEDRKARTEWLRAERRAENERRWRETNKLYQEKGLEPEPFSAFASQSDEEVIESLQTTPMSSRSAGSKRSWDGSVDGGSGDTGEGTDTDGESRRKRARS